MTTTEDAPFNLTRARVNAGLSMKGLARAADVHEHVVRALEGRVDRPVEPMNAKKVADYFGVEVTDLIDPDTLKSVLLAAEASA